MKHLDGLLAGRRSGLFPHGRLFDYDEIFRAYLTAGRRIDDDRRRRATAERLFEE